MQRRTCQNLLIQTDWIPLPFHVDGPAEPGELLRDVYGNYVVTDSTLPRKLTKMEFLHHMEVMFEDKTFGMFKQCLGLTNIDHLKGSNMA